MSKDTLFSIAVLCWLPPLFINRLVAHQRLKLLQNLGALAAEEGQVLLHQDRGVVAQLQTLQIGLDGFDSIFLVDLRQGLQVLVAAEQPLHKVLGGIGVLRVLEHGHSPGTQGMPSVG